MIKKKMDHAYHGMRVEKLPVDALAETELEPFNMMEKKAKRRKLIQPSCEPNENVIIEIQFD